MDHLPEVFKSSSLFVDPSFRAFKYWATKPFRESENKKTVHAYLYMNWSKLIIKEEIYKHHQHNNIYVKRFVLM